MNRRAGAFLAASVLAFVVPAHAATARRLAPVSGSLQLVSDYRWRGVSLSDGQPALQAYGDAERGGWFVGGWASLSATGAAGTEMDVLLGRRGRFAGLHYSLSAQAHVLNNAGDPRSFELVGEIGRQVGPASIDVELAYAPRQPGAGSDNVYAGASVGWDIPATPFSARIRGGLEDGFYRRKLDWEVGLSAPLGTATVAASLVGTVRRGEGGERSGTGIILSIGRSW